MNTELDFRFPADLGHLRVLRQKLREGLTLMGVADSMLDRVLLVMDEIVSNAIEHGSHYRQGEQPLRARVTMHESQHLFIQFEDQDTPSDIMEELAREMEQTNGVVPFAELERGRGLFLIRELFSEMQVLPMTGGGMLLEGWLRD